MRIRKWPTDLGYQTSVQELDISNRCLFIHCIVAMTDIHSATTESQATIDDAWARSRRSFIATLKVNRDVFSNLPERIEQWLEKETSDTNQPETTEHRFVRPHWRMNRTLEYTVRISCLRCSHICKFKCHIVKYIRFGVDETTSSSDFFLVKQERWIRHSTIRHGKAIGMFSSRNKREYSKVSRALIHMSLVHWRG